MRKQRAAFLIAVTLFFGGISSSASAAPATTAATSKGLYITPIRQYLSVDAGNSLRSTLTVANYTANSLDVTIAIKQFSVTPYTYNYTFQAPIDNWLHIGTKELTLSPSQKATIPYVITPPAASAPGGRYYTLVASAALSSQGISSTVQAADLVYITINGKLTTVSHLEGSHIPRLVFGHTIPFTLQPIDTGNMYSFVYVSGLLHGWLVRPPETSTAHLLMPGKVRTLSGSIASPLLPGMYRASYGYKTTAGWAIEKSTWIVFIPPWSVAFVLALALVLGKFLPRHRKPQQTAGRPD